MASVERTLLNHYNLTTLNPSEWPAEKDDDDEQSSEGEDLSYAAGSPLAKGTRRYTTINPDIHSRHKATRLQSSSATPGASVQKDEADPLGTTESVISTLRQRGLPVEDDLETRNKFLLSSTSFDPSQYLSEVHNNASTQDLLRGLDYLSHSIEQKSASLKVLVESNFERFVKAKATIDHVYKEMVNHGKEPETDVRTRARQHGNRASSSHFRNISGGQLSPAMKLHFTEKRKNALVKESDYGLIGIKAPLADATTRAEEVFSPALGGREREERLKTVLASIEQNRNIFEVGRAIDEGIKRRDYTGLAESYGHAMRLASDAKSLADRVNTSDVDLKDQEAFQIIMTARVWMEIEVRVGEFKRDTLRRLTGIHFSRQVTAVGDQQEEYMECISILLQLGTDLSPIWVWLLGRMEYLKNRINNEFERARIELEIQRRRLAIGPRTKQKVLAEHLRVASNPRRSQDLSDLDVKQIHDFWEKEMNAVNALLSVRTGVLGEVIEFWDIAQSFVDGSRQKELPMSEHSQSKQHHRLARDNVTNLRNGVAQLLGLIREQVHNLFVEAPIDDISALFTPTPQTPRTPASGLSPNTGRHFTFDTNDVPPPSPKTGDFSERFAFWPPSSNSLIASTYLSKINSAISTAAAEIAGLELVKEDTRLMQQLKILVGDVRERSVTAICAAWLVDSENCRELEDWTKATDKRDVTNLPAYFSAFETMLLSNLQKIVYLSDSTNGPNSADVILPPPQRHIETVQKGFKHSLYKAFSGMMEHAAKPGHEMNGEAASAKDGLTKNAPPPQAVHVTGEQIDGLSIGVRKLLTMSNFQALRNDVVPNLISTFEANFTMTISEDAKMARDVLQQMYARVFQSYVRPTYDHLRAVIISGITSSIYAATEASKPTDARPYVYEVLLTLVIVHSEASRIAPSLTPQILSYLLEQLSSAQMDAFKQRSKYSLGALMQATLDVEFLAQTLTSYTTQKASEVQSQIYLALDERTDNDARQRLQNGLPEMRAILKKLREKTKGEFGCFKKPRKSRANANDGDAAHTDAA